MASITNKSVLQFPTPTANWSAPTHFGLWSSASSSSSTAFLGSTPVTGTVSAPEADSVVQFAIDALTVTVPNGEFTDVGVNKMINGLVESMVYVSLHSASPGSDGSNELSGSAYARVSVSSGTSGWNGLS